MAELHNPVALVSAMEETTAASFPVWPMTAGVAAAGVALNIVCSYLQKGTLPAIALPIAAASLLFIAAMIGGVAVRMIYLRVVRGQQKMVTSVVRAACLTSLWLPSWALFMATSSPLAMAAAGLCLACMGMFLKRGRIDADAEIVLNAPHQPGTPFLFPDGLLVRKLLPSLWLVLLLDATVALAAAGWFFMASLTAAIFAGVLVWRATLPSAPGIFARKLPPRPGQAAIAIAAFALTMIALLPYLRAGLFENMSTVAKKTAVQAGPEATGEISSKGYIGIILMPLKDQQKKIVAPVRRDFVPHFGVKISDPLEIPFDGQYWYFKWPDKRPRPNARVVRASSTKTQVSSSTRTPLLMEAHQRLIDPMDLGCCSAINLIVENADQLNGAISLELWVRKLPNPKTAAKQRVNAMTSEDAPHYLGTMAIPSSQLPIGDRPNASGRTVPETLSFPIPAGLNGTVFDEITVVVKTAPERARMGAKVAIRKFVLEP
ncbi:hypothetical protein [Edaphobacter sp. 12200R-103]|uniref:hypothetical protein n=1 Tax=Edaphobacter sp. 12200R-103 TaxID=2703788 RepID=UPI00138CE3F7|nr:hypothetical protein [Edaphobacter sp. 12200R-103]QHS52591.1 hypothetical protein GWR55_13325 [Edaphobacter sp. 12200R-103]